MVHSLSLSAQRVLAAVAASVSSAAPIVCMAEPIAATPLERVGDAGPVRGWIVEIDLRDPRVEVVVTRPRSSVSADGGAAEAVPLPTDEWARQEGLVLAVNAGFFGSDRGGLDVKGLSMSDGTIVSPLRDHEGRGDPALLFRADGTAAVTLARPADLAGVVDAVAGIGGGERDATPGTLLVDDGVNLGTTARVEPANRHPRTGAGVTRDGGRLIVAIVDGRQPEWSVGVTLPELADILLDAGAYDAVNLDGGGSTSLYWDDGDGEATTNRPSDGRFRPVANHLGIRLRDEARPAATEEGTEAR